MNIADRIAALESARRDLEPPEPVAVALPLGETAFLPNENDAAYRVRQRLPPERQIIRVGLIDGRRPEREPMRMRTV